MRCRFTLGNLACLLCYVVLAGTVTGDEVAVPIDKLPQRIVDAVKKAFPLAELIEATAVRDDDELEYEISIKVAGQSIEIVVDEDGELEGMEKSIDLKDLPKVVQNAIAARYPKCTPKSAEAIYELKKDSAKLQLYEVTLTTADGNEVEVSVTPSGEIQDKSNDEEQDSIGWSDDFRSEKDGLASSGRNPFFVLEAGYQLTLDNGNERLVITVLDETKKIDDVECRIVEERETKNDQLIEVSRNYVAISRRTGNVYYFGEEVDEYENGKVVSHKGAWLSGIDGARFGLLMPGLPLLGSKYYQEVAPGKAMDRAQVISVSESLKTPAGEFQNCLKVLETNPLKPTEKEYKIYAAGIGLIRDGNLLLVKHGKKK